MAAPPPVLTLAVKKGPREGETRQCRAGAALRVGRVVTGNDLAVRDAGASQRHLAIEFLPPPATRWVVSDLGSSNGTLLNGAPIAPTVPAPLSHGDVIKIGEATVLAVSIASDSDRNPGLNPGPRRSSRRASAAAVAVEEEKPPVVTSLGGRKEAAAAAEPPNAEKEELDAAAVVEDAEKPPVVARRGGRRKVAAVEPSEAGKEEPDKAAEATRRGGRRKVTEPPEPEKEEEETAVVTLRRGRKKDAATIAPPPLPPKTRSGRGRGRVTRASARKAVLEEEDEEEHEVVAPREGGGNPPMATAAKGGEKEKEDGVAAGDGEVEGTAKASEEEVPMARRGRPRRAPKGRANAQCAASDNEGEEEKGGGEEEDGKREVIGSGGEVGDGEVVEEHAGRSSLETMTLREWFERMEKYLPRMINEAADEMIASLQERHRCVDEYISTLREISDPS